VTTALETFRGMVAGEIEGPPVAKLLGMRMTEIDEGRAVFVLDAGPQHTSPLGTVHGGIICDVADAALGCAHASLLAEGETFATIELKINFLKPIWSGRLTAVGTVVKAGRTVGLTECRVTDDGGSLVAYATATCMTLRGEAAVGR
jgi:uncharacterized protein (TIGR00369 family)